jgi:hypothetical protein
MLLAFSSSRGTPLAQHRARTEEALVVKGWRSVSPASRSAATAACPRSRRQRPGRCLNGLTEGSRRAAQASKLGVDRGAVLPEPGPGELGAWRRKGVGRGGEWDDTFAAWRNCEASYWQ